MPFRTGMPITRLQTQTNAAHLKNIKQFKAQAGAGELSGAVASP
jgi:hypothetical protein